jgi:hypothetical protein
MDPNDAYLGQYHEWLVNGIPFYLMNPVHSNFASCMTPPLIVGVPQTEGPMNSMIQGDVFFDGAPLGHFTATASMTVWVELASTFGATRTLSTELTQLDADFGGGQMLREDPSQRSLGTTTITDLGNGDYPIDSFFDVFTELSLDGGQNWIPSAGPLKGASRMTLGDNVPEPLPAILIGGGLLLIMRRLRGR